MLTSSSTCSSRPSAEMHSLTSFYEVVLPLSSSPYRSLSRAQHDLELPHLHIDFLRYIGWLSSPTRL